LPYSSAVRNNFWQALALRRTLLCVQNPRDTERFEYCVVGVDPAAAGATGYGVIERSGSLCRMLRFGALRPRVPLRGSVSTHLCDIYQTITGLIQEFQPDAVAVESVFAALNVKTALRLAEVRGVVLLSAAQAGIPSFSYSPREVKAMIAGYGHAGKQQVQHMVRALLGMSETPEPPDAADALAVALCHMQMAHSPVRLAAAREPVSPGALRTTRRRNREAALRISVT
jgi:crossover junction endodeoxyribonuclease RuvC